MMGKVTPSVAAMQVLAPVPNPATLMGQYVNANLERKASFGYLPFHHQCWDVPVWAVGICQRMWQPNLVLVSPEEAPQIAGSYEVVFGSVLVENLDAWRQVVRANPATCFVLGGYVPYGQVGYSNVLWCDSIDEGYQTLAKLQGYREPLVHHSNYYPSLGTVINGARIQLGTGCSHSCPWCSISGKGKPPIPVDDVYVQLSPLAGHLVGVVYVGDKTFGQASNWPMLGKVGEVLQPSGFVIQSTAVQITIMGLDTLRTWRDIGIISVEVGVESYNDPILKRYHKPAREKIIDRAVELLCQSGLLFSPNIMVGLDGESRHTYARTANWLQHVGNLGWVNVYCVADHGGVGDDASEATPIKSWQTVRERQTAVEGFKLVYGAAVEAMRRPV